MTDEEQTEIVEFDPPMAQDDFDFFDVAAERTFPKDILDVYLDEAAAYDFNKLSREIDLVVEPSKDLVAEFAARAEALRNRLRDSKYTFYLTGTSDDNIEAAAEVAKAQFEDKKKQRKTATQSIERYLPEDQQLPYLKFFNAVVNSLHIEKVYRHKDGKTIVAPSPDFIAHFYDKAPDAAKKALTEKISSLRLTAKEYETALDEGFFQKS